MSKALDDTAIYSLTLPQHAVTTPLTDLLDARPLVLWGDDEEDSDFLALPCVPEVNSLPLKDTLEGVQTQYKHIWFFRVVHKDPARHQRPSTHYYMCVCFGIVA